MGSVPMNNAVFHLVVMRVRNKPFLGEAPDLGTVCRSSCSHWLIHLSSASQGSCKGGIQEPRLILLTTLHPTRLFKIHVTQRSLKETLECKKYLPNDNNGPPSPILRFCSGRVSFAYRTIVFDTNQNRRHTSNLETRFYYVSQLVI